MDKFIRIDCKYCTNEYNQKEIILINPINIVQVVLGFTFKEGKEILLGIVYLKNYDSRYFYGEEANQLLHQLGHSEIRDNLENLFEKKALEPDPDPDLGPDGIPF